MSTLESTAAPARPESVWGRRLRQIGAVVRLEIKKGFLGRRSLWLYLLAAAPLLILSIYALVVKATGKTSDVAGGTMALAFLYQVFFLRIVLFLSCVGVFGNLIRREVLDRSLHYYFLSPIRRDLLVLAKYFTGLVVTFTIFGGATLAAFVLAYLPYDRHAVQQYLFHNPSFAIGHLASYLLVTCLACVGYGAVFMTFGFYFKSPIVPALAVMGWEQINHLLPPLFKKVSVIYYLEGLCPVPIPDAPVAYLADAPPPWLSVIGLIAVAALLAYISTFRVRTMEVSYEEG